MITFSYEDLFIAARGDPHLIIQFLEYSTGYDFILDEYPLFLPVSALVKAEYLGIASLRGIDKYMLNGDNTLDIDLIPPHHDIQIIQTNPLISVEGGKILFPYEGL